MMFYAVAKKLAGCKTNVYWIMKISSVIVMTIFSENHMYERLFLLSKCLATCTRKNYGKVNIQLTRYEMRWFLIF